MESISSRREFPQPAEVWRLGKSLEPRLCQALPAGALLFLAPHYQISQDFLSPNDY